MEGNGLVRDYSTVIDNLQQYIDDQSIFKYYDKDQFREILKCGAVNPNTFNSLLNLGKKSFKTSKLFQYVQPATVTVNNLDDAIYILESIQSCLKLQFSKGLIEFLQTVKVEMEQKQQEIAELKNRKSEQQQETTGQPIYDPPPSDAESDNSNIGAACADLVLKYEALVIEHIALSKREQELKNLSKRLFGLIELYASNNYGVIYNKLREFTLADPELTLATANLLGVTDKEDEDGNNILLSACKIGELDFVMHLLDGKASIRVNKFGNNPLYNAVLSRNINLVKALLSRGFDKKFISSKSGNNLLHAGVISGSLEMVKFLLSQGLDLDTWNNSNLAPISLAVINNQRIMIEFLLRQKMTDFYNGQALALATKHSSVELFKFISDSKPSWRGCYRNDFENNWKLTVVHSAIFHKRADILEYIISSGQFDLKQKCSRGLTPLKFAENNYKNISKDYKEVYEMIKRATSLFGKIFK